MLDLFYSFLEADSAYFALYTPADWTTLVALLMLIPTLLYLFLTHKPKRSLMDSHHYVMYRKLAGAAAKPFDEVKHFSVCTAQNGSKVLMDLGSGRRTVIQQLGG